MPVPNLSDEWARWCRLVDALALVEGGSAGPLAVYERLRRFSSMHQADTQHIEGILYALYRGVPLLMAALRWEEPEAGRRSDSVSATDEARGEQWRFVMGYAGLETVVRALLVDDKPGGFNLKQFRTLIKECVGLPEYALLQPPRLSEKIQEKWLQDAVAADHPRIRFLGISNEDAVMIRRWLIEQQPITSWEAALVFAQALRNVTVHGALSATKIKEWKLPATLETLLRNLEQIIAAALARLNEP